MAFHNIRRVLGTTVARLTLLYTLIFGVLAVGVVSYISISTGRLVIQQVRVTVDEEVQQLARIYRRFGTRRMIATIERRSRQPGANLYRVMSRDGIVLAGNVASMDERMLDHTGWRLHPFRYERGTPTPGPPPLAIGRVFDLTGGAKLLVGRDIGDANTFRSIVRRASSISITVLVLTGLFLVLVLGRRAVRRLDTVTATTGRIVEGDLSQRLPVSSKADEFDRLSVALNEVLERVERLDSGVRNVSDNIAHDLKTPLTRLRNRADALARSNDPKETVDTAQNIVAEADGLIRTFDALLLISQTESGARPVALARFEIVPIVESVFELFEPSTEEAGVELTLNVECEPQVEGHRELLAQVLTNLLDNALKYAAGKDAAIEMSVECTSDDILLVVADNGPGIAKEDRAIVRERFVRLDESRTTKGFGLGLAMVEAVARVHNGSLMLDDNEPGLRAILRLPRIV